MLLRRRGPRTAANTRLWSVTTVFSSRWSSEIPSVSPTYSAMRFRTIFSAFHHFSPEDARAILQNAVDASQSIGIFEITRRAPSTIGLMFPWALMSFVSTPFIRPFRWSRLLWTYLVPIIPLVLLFDGVVSCLRTYRPEELRNIIEKLAATEYQWDIGEQSGGPGKVPITYLVGYQRSSVLPPCVQA